MAIWASPISRFCSCAAACSSGRPRGAYGIIKNHNGLITVHSELGKGSIFTVFLPATETPLRPEKAGAGPARRMTETILAVEEEPEVRDILENMLNRLGFKVLKAKDGKQALDICRRTPTGIDLAILDSNMSPALINEILNELRKFNPNVKGLLSMGGSLSEQQEKMVRQHGLGFLQKPFSLTQLSSNLTEILSA